MGKYKNVFVSMGQAIVLIIFELVYTVHLGIKDSSTSSLPLYPLLAYFFMGVFIWGSKPYATKKALFKALGSALALTSIFATKKLAFGEWQAFDFLRSIFILFPMEIAAITAIVILLKLLRDFKNM